MILVYFIVSLIIKYSKKTNIELTDEEMKENKIIPNESAITSNDIDSIIKNE